MKGTHDATPSVRTQYSASSYIIRAKTSKNDNRTAAYFAWGLNPYLHRHRTERGATCLIEARYLLEKLTQHDHDPNHTWKTHGTVKGTRDTTACVQRRVVCFILHNPLQNQLKRTTEIPHSLHGDRTHTCIGMALKEEPHVSVSP